MTRSATARARGAAQLIGAVSDIYHVVQRTLSSGCRLNGSRRSIALMVLLIAHLARTAPGNIIGGDISLSTSAGRIGASDTTVSDLGGRMGAARYVGRIGGLAVALGIGTAAFTGHGVAWADADSAAPSGHSASPETAAGPAHASRSKISRKPSRLSHRGQLSAHAAGSPASLPSTSPSVNGTQKSTTNRPASRASLPEPLAHTVTASADVSGSLATPLAETAPKSPPVKSPASSVVPVLLVASRRDRETSNISYTPTVGITNGVITGTNQVAAPSLVFTYTVVSDPSGGGKVDIDKNTGSFTYLPYSSGLNADGTEKFAASEQFKVLVAETTPLDAALEKLPVLGALVPPVLVQIHQLPILGEALSPLIGSAMVVPVTINDAQLAEQNVDPIAFTATVVSFDGTPISVNYFPAVGLKKGQVAPTILNGPSLATAGYTDPNQTTTVFGLVPGLAPLRADGYNVVTWDPRGEFASGGVLQLDSPDYEAKDVSWILTWVASQPETTFDPGTGVDPGRPSTPDGSVNNPLIGMVGGSYGGGIQLTSAGIDKRIDAIAPGIAWNSLDTSLYPNGGFKTSWASLLLLSLVVSGSRIDPEIYSGILTGAALGFLTPGQRDFLKDASPYNVVDNITVPTVFLQGTVDDLFPLQQAIDNAEQIEATSPAVPVKMIWYCGGHGQCLDPVNGTEQTAFLTQETLDWMDEYVKYKGATPPAPIDIPNFQWVDQHGNLYSSQYLPTSGSPLYSASTPISVTSSGGILAIAPIIGGSGPQPKAQFPLSLALGTPAANAINVPVTASTSTGPTYIVGAPTVTMTYAGLGTSRVVYAQFVDTNTGRVVGNILTPIPVTLDGATRTVTVSTEDIAYTAEPGDSLTLQIVGSATPFENFTSYGAIDISQVDVTVPTANPADVDFEQSFTTDQAPAGSGGLLGI